MSINKSGYADICADALQVVAGRKDEKPGVWFGDAFVETPESGLFTRAVLVGSQHFAIIKGQQTGTAFAIAELGSRVQPLGPTQGNYCVGLAANPQVGALPPKSFA